MQGHIAWPLGGASFDSGGFLCAQQSESHVPDVSSEHTELRGRLESYEFYSQAISGICGSTQGPGRQLDDRDGGAVYDQVRRAADRAIGDRCEDQSES